MLRLDAARQELVAGVEPELRAAAEAIGMALRDQLVKLAPSLTKAGESGADPEAVLVGLDLDHEGEPDAVSLVACLAAHRFYVGARGRPDGVSSGALAIARLLVWAQRAAMLGPPPRIGWIGPAPRRPDDEGRIGLSARCALEVGGQMRRAEAVALIVPPEPAGPQG